MPFVRIDLMRGKPAEYRKALGEIVYQAMIDVINVPKDDKFQVIIGASLAPFSRRTGPRIRTRVHAAVHRRHWRTIWSVGRCP
jgi:Tautomerase enzyme